MVAISRQNIFQRSSAHTTRDRGKRAPNALEDARGVSVENEYAVHCLVLGGERRVHDRLA
jgi:hypothetical protein